MTEENKDYMQIIENRRSVNFFDSSRELEDELLKKIINRSVLAPSSFNLQPWKLLAVKSQEKREEIYNSGACGQQKVIDAPVLLIVTGDMTGYRRYNPMWDEKKNLGKLDEEKMEEIIEQCEQGIYPDEAKKIGFAVRNSSLLAMNIMNTAKYYGVDTHPMIGFSETKIKEMFDLDDNIVVTMLISMGYFDEEQELNSRETRLKYEDITEEH